MHTPEMYITDLMFMLIVLGCITIGVFVYSKYLDWKEKKVIDIKQSDKEK